MSRKVLGAGRTSLHIDRSMKVLLAARLAAAAIPVALLMASHCADLACADASPDLPNSPAKLVAPLQRDNNSPQRLAGWLAGLSSLPCSSTAPSSDGVVTVRTDTCGKWTYSAAVAGGWGHSFCGGQGRYRGTGSGLGFLHEYPWSPALPCR